MEDYEKQITEAAEQCRTRVQLRLFNYRKKLHHVHAHVEDKLCNNLTCRAGSARRQLEDLDQRCAKDEALLSASEKLADEIIMQRRHLTARSLKEHEVRMKELNDGASTFVENFRKEHDMSIPSPPRIRREDSAGFKKLMQPLEKDMRDGLPAIAAARNIFREQQHDKQVAVKRSRIQQNAEKRELLLEAASSRVAKSVAEMLQRFVAELEKKEAARIRAAKFQEKKRDPIRALAVERLEAEYDAQD